MTAPLGFVVLSKRPNPQGGFGLEPAEFKDGRYLRMFHDAAEAENACGYLESKKPRYLDHVEYGVYEVREKQQ